MPSFLILSVFFLLAMPAVLRDQTEQPPNKPETAAPAPALPAQAPIPASAAARPNPVHATAESQARAKRIYTIDCAMCHGEDGSGKGDVSTTATMLDYRDPRSLKLLTDGGIYYIIENGRGEMPPEGARAKPDETWNLVLYLRSFGKKNANAPGSP